jgi:hypothetical protein
VRARLAREYARFVVDGAPDIDSEILVHASASDRPRIRVVSHGKACRIEDVLRGPENNRFRDLGYPGRLVFADTVMGCTPAVEVEGDDLIVLLAEQWPVYTFCLQIWLMLHEAPIVGMHAAATAVGQHALMLIGPSGSGKSTLSYALHRRGAHYFGDDCVFFTQPDYRLYVCHHDPRMRPGGIDALKLNEAEMDWFAAKPGDLKCDLTVPEAQMPCPQERISLLFIRKFASEPKLMPIGGGEAALRLLRGMSYGDPALSARIDAATALVNRFDCSFLDIGGPSETAELLMDHARMAA